MLLFMFVTQVTWLYKHGIDFYVDNMDPVGFTGMLNYLLLSLIQNNAFV